MPGLKVEIDTDAAERASANLKKTLKALGSTAVENEKEFKKLEDRLEKGMKADKAKTEIDSLTKSLKLSRLEMAQHQARIGDYSGAFRTIVSGSNLASKSIVGLSASIGLIAGLVGSGGVLYKSVEAFSDIDKSLVGVQKTTGLTDEELKQFKDTITDMSMEVPVLTSKLLEIAEAAGQMGIKGTKNLALFTETIAMLELTTDLSGETAAKTLARILNTSGEAIEGINTLGSVIVALGNNVEASESEIVNMASEISRSVSAYKVSSAASAAYAAALKSMGAQAELSGSSISKAMIEIEQSIVKGGDKFNYLQEVTGMTGDQIKETFYTDASKVFNAWIHGLNNMTEEGYSAISLLEKFNLTGVETIKGLTPLIMNVGKLDKAFNIAGAEVKDSTALVKEAIAASKSFSAQMSLTLNAVDLIASSIGSGLAPKILDITGKFKDWVKDNDEFIKQDLPEYVDSLASSIFKLGEKISNITSNVSVNAKALALAETGQISWFDFLTKSTNQLGVLIDDFDKYSDNADVVGMSFTAWQEKIESLTAKYKLLNEQIQRGKDFGTLTTEGESNLIAQREEIERQIQATKNLLVYRKTLLSSTPGENHRNDYYDKIFNNKKTGQTQSAQSTSVNIKTVTDNSEAEKRASEIAAAYQSAYSSLDTLTKSVYDNMAASYKKDYDDFIKLTGDKVTAQAVYAQQMEALNKKMLGEDPEAEKINKHIAALQNQADVFKMTAAQADLYDLKTQGATESQLKQAESIYKTLDALEKQKALETEGAQLKENLKSETEKLSDEFAHLKEMLDANAIGLTTYNTALLSAADKSLGFDTKTASDDSFSAQTAFENEQYASRLSLLEQYRQERSDLNAEWDEKEQRLKKQHEATLTEIERSRQDMMLSSSAQVFDSLSGMASTFAGEQSGVYKAMFAASKAFTLAQASLNMWDAVGDVGATQVTWADKLAAMAAMAATMGGVISSIASIGMAHEGYESIPETGSWYLKKGERVTTEKTSKSLDKTLNSIQSGLNQQAPASAKPMNMNIYESPNTSVKVTQSKDGNSYDVVVQEIEKEVLKRIDRGTGLSSFLDRRYKRRW